MPQNFTFPSYANSYHRQIQFRSSGRLLGRDLGLAPRAPYCELVTALLPHLNDLQVLLVADEQFAV
jgi:hypothetical protein